MKAEACLNQLTRRVKDEEGRKNEVQFRGQWRKRFSICLQKSNSNVTMKKLRAISEVGNGAWDDTEAARRSKLYSLDAFAYLYTDAYWKVLDSSTVVLSALVMYS